MVMTRGWNVLLKIPGEFVPSEDVGAGVAKTTTGVVCWVENGAGEDVGCVDLNWFTGVVRVWNTGDVVTAATGFGWKQNFSIVAPVTECDTSQGSSLLWVKPPSPHWLTASV